MTTMRTTPMASASGRLHRLTADATAGGLVAFLGINFSLSYAALLFGRTSAATQAQGLVLLLAGTVIVAIVGARFSSLPFSILFADGTLIALLASVISEIAADLRSAPAATVAATALTTVLVATFATGAALWLIGRVRGGGVVRYIPFQVMAGILAASGWALTSGGAAVSAGRAADLGLLADPAALAKLVPAVVLAIVMMIAAARFQHPVTLALTLLAAILIHHAVFLVLGWTVPEQRAAGWLAALPPDLKFSLPWSAERLAAVDWHEIVGHAPELVALIPVTAICLLLGLNGIEAATGRDVEVDRDLQTNGIGALACGVLGGVLAITSVSRTVLAYNMGVRGRGAGIIAALTCGIVPLALPNVLGFVPRFVLGGLLIYAGFGMLQQWLIRSRQRLTWSEWLTVVAVLAVAVRFGLIAGAFSGLLLGCATFAVIYSQSSPIRARYRGEAARSRVDRSITEEARLAVQADTLLVLHLQGFVFFGTANRMVEEIRREITRLPGVLRHILLDFSNVEGLDGSALAGFERLERVAAADAIVVAFVAMDDGVARRLAGSGFPGGPRRVFATLDEALEWRESTVFADIADIAAQPLSALLAAEFDDPEATSAFLATLDVVEFTAGDVILQQGDLSNELLFIEEGWASVAIRFHDSNAMRVRAFGVGAMLGEIGFCLGLPRTATVKAEAPCRMLKLTREMMDDFEGRLPSVALAIQRAVLRRVSRRLIEKDQLISALLLDRRSEMRRTSR